MNCRTNILTFSLGSGSISRLCKKLSKCSLSFEIWKLVWTTLQDPYSTYLSSQNYSFVRLSVCRWDCASDACKFEPQKNLVLSRFISEKPFSMHQTHKDFLQTVSTYQPVTLSTRSTRPKGIQMIQVFMQANSWRIEENPAER